MAERYEALYRLKLFVLSRVADMRLLHILDDVYHVLCLPLGFVVYVAHRLLGRPYFGIWLGSSQGNPFRHKYMTKTIDVLVARLAARGQSPASATVRVLEIGAYAGGSVIQWGLALKRHRIADAKVFAVDPWQSYVNLARNRRLRYRMMNRALADGKIRRLFEYNVKAAGVANLCVAIEGRSADAVAGFAEGTLDLVYIDGDHHVDSVRSDLRLALPLLKNGGFLCGDDLEMQLADVDADFARRNVDSDMVVDPATGVAYHPGVTIAVAEFFGRRISCYEGYWMVQKNGRRLDDVSLG